MSDTKTIVVIGGGISGITAALEAAEAGYKSVIVEKGPSLGGRVSRLNQYFPKMCPPTCGLEINFKRIKSNPDVEVHTLAQVHNISGGPGNYTVSVQVMPRYVNSNCTMCGDCAKACTAEIDDEFNYGLKKIKAAYLPNRQSYPAAYVLDKSIIGTPDADAVKAACKYKAVDLNMKDESIEINAAAVIVATGWQPYDASKIANYGFGANKNVISNVMMERLCETDGPTGGKILRPSDGKEPAKVAFLQCAGSRDENNLNYCSGVCCAATIKQLSYVREKLPNAEISVFYIDIRTPGRLEDLYLKAQDDEKITFRKGKAVKLEEDASGSVSIDAEDTLTGVKCNDQADLVIMATGMQSNLIGADIPGVNLDENGFVLPDSEGIIGCGVAKRPVDVATSVQDATGAALKAIQCVGRS